MTTDTRTESSILRPLMGIGAAGWLFGLIARGGTQTCLDSLSTMIKSIVLDNYDGTRWVAGVLSVGDGTATPEGNQPS